MTYYYSYASLNYTILNIIIRWCIFYCIWNLWTLPRLEESYELIDISMRVPGNETVVQESLPVHIINGRKTVMISGLMQSFKTTANDNMESKAHVTSAETKSVLRLASHDSSIQTRKEPQEVLQRSPNHQPPQRQQRSTTKRRIPGRYQMSNREIQSQGHALNSKATAYNPNRRLVPSKTPVARRLRKVSLPDSRLEESSALVHEQPRQKYAFVLLAFSGALIGGGVFALRSLKRLEKWEIQSQEDSLAYDIAFTTKGESNYGSFDSQPWHCDLSKYDV